MIGYPQEQAMRRALNRQRFLQGLPSIPDNMPVTMDPMGLPQEMPLNPFAARPASPFPSPPSPPRAAPDPIPAGMPRPPMPTGVNFDMARAKQAIAAIESRGAKNPYSLLGKVTKKGDVALGKYQVMASNVKQWSRQALGREISPREFLNSPEAQEKVFEHQFSTLANRFGPKGAAMAWFGGPGYAKKMHVSDIHGRINIRQYGDIFERNYARGDGTTPPIPAPTMTAELPMSAPAPAPRRIASAQDQPLRLAPASFQARQQDAPPQRPQATAYAPPPPRPAAVAAIDQAIAPRPQGRSPLSLAPPALQQPTPAQPEMRWQGPMGENDMGRYEEVGVEPPNGLNSFFRNLFSPAAAAPAPAPETVPMPRPRPQFAEGQAAPAMSASPQTPQALPLAPFQQPPYPMDWWQRGFGGGFQPGFGLPAFNFDLHLGG